QPTFPSPSNFFNLYSGLRNTAANGGSVSSIENGRPCCSIGSAITPPPLPIPLPAYSLPSLLSFSFHQPPVGTPTRYFSRGTGVKLHATSITSSGDFPLRSRDTTLMGASLQSTHSKPAESLSSSCKAFSLR